MSTLRATVPPESSTPRSRATTRLSSSTVITCMCSRRINVDINALSGGAHRRNTRDFLYVSTLSIELDENADAQTNFDSMYGVMRDLLDTFYPEREITMTSSDPPYVTPTVKALLRCKNRLMRAGRTDEAGSIAARIRTIITRSSTRWLWTVNTRKSAKAAWAKVRDVTKGSAIRAGDHQIDGLTAQSLNNH